MPIPDNQMTRFEVVVTGTLASGGAQAQTTKNVFHYRRTNNPAEFNAANFRAALIAKFNAQWLAVASAAWNYDTLGVRCLNDAEHAESVSVVNTAGGIAGDAEPGQNAMLISKKSILRGRSNQGRMYLCGVPESGAAGNVITAGQLVLLQALAAKLLETVTDADGNQYVPCIFSRKNSVIETNPTNVVTVDIASLTAKSIIASMDSRHAKIS